MRAYIGRHQVLTHDDLVELGLGLGVDAELVVGPVDPEGSQERAARVAAAIDYFTDHPEMAPGVVAVMVAALEADPYLLDDGEPDAGVPALVGGGVR